jgi:hypothetical protein
LVVSHLPATWGPSFVPCLSKLILG